jgi:hypothetical protein
VIYPDGIIYESNFENGKYHGKGIMINHNNTIYDGFFKNNKIKNKKINIIIDLHGKTNDQGVCVLYTQNDTKENNTVSFIVDLINKIKKEKSNISRIKINLTSCLQKINKEQIECIVNKIGCINLKIAYSEYVNYSAFYLNNAPVSIADAKKI